LNLLEQTHPFHALRAAELMRWSASGDYPSIRRGEYRRRSEQPGWINPVPDLGSAAQHDAGQAKNFATELSSSTQKSRRPGLELRPPHDGRCAGRRPQHCGQFEHSLRSKRVGRRRALELAIVVLRSPRMLLLDDDDELPDEPEEEERALAAQLGPEGLRAIDIALARCSTQRRWLKIARVIADALRDRKFDITSEAANDLHARRVIVLIEAGVLLVQGDPRRPRFSEVRLPAPASVEGG
jgi:hypothetical protein